MYTQLIPTPIPSLHLTQQYPQLQILSICIRWRGTSITIETFPQLDEEFFPRLNVAARLIASQTDRTKAVFDFAEYCLLENERHWNRAICMSVECTTCLEARLAPSTRHSTLMKLTQRQIGRPRRFDPRQGVVESAAAVHCVLRILVVDFLRLRVYAFAFDPHVLRMFVVPRVQLRWPPPDPLPGLFAVTLAGGRGCDREDDSLMMQ